MDNCKECGTKLEQGQVFCHNCGAKITNQSQMPEFDYELNSESTDTEDNNISVAPAVKAVPDTAFKGKSKSKLAAVVIAAVLVLTAGILVFAKPFSKSGMNPASDPDAYLKNVFEKMIDEAKAEHENSFSKLTDTLKADNVDSSYDVNLDLKLGSLATNLLSGSGIDISNLTLDFSYDKQGEDTLAGAAVSLNSNIIASIQALYNATSEDAYLRIPELSSSYIKFSAKDLLNELLANVDYSEIYNYGLGTDELSLFMNKLTEYFNTPPSEKDVEKTNDAYLEVLFSTLFTDVQFEEDVTINVDDISVKYNSFNVDLTYNRLYSLIDGILDAMLNDNVYSTMIDEFCKKYIGMSLSQLSTELKSSKNDLLEYGTEKICDITFYIDQKDDILKGVELTFVDTSNVVIGYKKAANDSKNRMTFYVIENGQELFTIKNRYTDKNDVLNGELIFAYSEYDSFFNEYAVYEIKADYSDLKCDSKKGILKGSIVLTSTVPELQGASLSLIFDCSEESSKLTIDVAYLAQSLVNLKIEVSKDNGGSIPSIDTNQPVYDISSNINALDEYIINSDFDNFVNSILNKLGLDSGSLNNNFY